MFPAMKPIEITDRQAVESCTGRLPCSSFHGFTSMWIWNIDERTRLARLGMNLVFEYTDLVTKDTSMTLLGDDDVVAAAAELLTQTRELHAIPSFVASQLPPQRFSIARDRDLDEYVCDVQRLSTLSGRSLGRRRNAANRCARVVGKNLRVEHDVGQLQGGLLDLFDRWSATRAKTDQVGTFDERRAVERLLAAWQNLNLTVTSIYDGDVLFAAQVHEVVPDCAIAHIAKADVSYWGSFSLLMKTSAEYLSTLGLRELNLQEDLGIEGLRASKLRWRPVRMEEKYRVRAGRPGSSATGT